MAACGSVVLDINESAPNDLAQRVVESIDKGPNPLWETPRIDSPFHVHNLCKAHFSRNFHK
ncbi:hypothetical protein MNBD_PLANCTO03-814 [hydrothermal vent metagenome]|uniref:Uncharacterized protein n=1 Tax=hydrothermal vent metagenome TaxID=652676 RepID=A0A3B1DHB1_9ZZZZ